jgi:hypothetical protein
MNYAVLKNTWACNREIRESYEPKVTMSLNEWKDYIGDGKNVLYGSAVIPNGSTDDGAVYKGQVAQVSGCSCRSIF